MGVDLDDLARDAVASSPTRVPEMSWVRRRATQRRRRRRRIGAAVTVVPIVVVVAFASWWVVEGQSERGLTASYGPVLIGPDLPISGAGGFVWPDPGRQFSSLDELTDAFVVEVLAWPAAEVRLDPDTNEARRALSVVDVAAESRVDVVAAQSPDGWGLVRVGDGEVTVGQIRSGGVVVRFDAPTGTASSVVEVRFADGEISTETVTTAEAVLGADRSGGSVESVLVVHRDEVGDVIAVSGARFGTDDAEISAAALSAGVGWAGFDVAW